MAFRVSVDSGGTFTDGVLINEKGEVVTAKAHTTPQDLTLGTIECLSKLASLSGMTLKDLLGRTNTIVHGTTLATNIVVSRSGAKLGAITTRGYRDRMTFLHVAKGELKGDIRVGTTDLFNFRMDPPKPLTRRYLTTEVEERVNYKGEVLIPLNEDDVRRAVAYLKKQGVESIAVILLFSHLYPAHERRIGEMIKEDFPEAYVSLSSTVLPVWGEVGRWSTTMFGAYVGPKVIGYATKVKKLLIEKGFRGELVFMQSNGGVATTDIVCENPATLLISGPAAGPSMGLALAREHQAENVVSVDMGGTSFDVGAVPEGQINVVQMKVIDGKKFCLPSVDVSTIGAGGGSIAWIDASGRLQVGPQSAGASPGPACYGMGGKDPTVTDADVVLGYIDPDYFLGGETKLRKDLAEKAIQEKIAGRLKLSVPKAAAAIYDVVNAKMAGAIDVVFSRRGYDPREFILCAAGGAAPVHSARLMEELGIRHLMIPKVAPVYCAFGMMYADLKHSFTRPLVCETAKVDLDRINTLYGEMEKEAIEILQREGVAAKDVLIEKTMDVRYYGQVREQNTSVPKGAVTAKTLRVTMDRFHEKHRKVIGYSDPNYPTEIVRLHLEGIARVKSPRLQKVSRGTRSAQKAIKGTRRAFFSEFEDFVEVKVYDGNELSAGNILEGPCIIEEKMTTVVIPPGIRIKVDPYGNYTTIGSGVVKKSMAASSQKVKKSKGVDPTTLSVVWNRFESILDEIGEKVMHATQSFVMANVRDLGQVLLDPKGEIVASSGYIVSHMFKAPEAAHSIQKKFGNKFDPGDFIIANDPYIIRGAHLPDWTFLRPLFYKGELFGFFHFSGHMSDTGGFLPGGYGPGAYDIIAEGLNIPPLKILQKGILNKDVWELLLRNVRNPTQVDMDTMLINGAFAQGEEQIVRLIDKYGLKMVRACMEEIIDAGERAARAEIAKMPDGVYYGEAGTDWDGQTDKPIWVRVKATIKGEEITFDLSESDPQASFVNSPIGTTWFAVMTAFYSMVDPSVPKNHGSMKVVHLIAREGTVCNPKYPATVGACQISVGNPICEACQLALGKAVPEKAMGGFPRHFCPITIGMDPTVIDPRTGTPKQYFAETFASDGSGGAMKGYDGWQGVGFFPSVGNLARPDIEIFESQVPFRVPRYELLQDWEGAGEFRGGSGIYVEMVADTKPGAPTILMTGNSDGQIVPAVGAASGELRKAEAWIVSPNGKTRILRTMSNEPVFPGEICYTKCSGGGGWGNPLNRDIKRVQDDAMDGLISIERARDVYGVIIDPNTFEVQQEATERLRRELKGKKASSS